ncbi:MAG: hypothetical protein ACLQVD_13230 [Capsulimonadaceae bacterium]
MGHGGVITSSTVDRYLDHFARYLGEPDRAALFSVADGLPPIRILSYNNVIAGCRVFASLGLSAYLPEGASCEVICPVDTGWDEMPAILADGLFHFVGRAHSASEEANPCGAQCLGSFDEDESGGDDVSRATDFHLQRGMAVDGVGRGSLDRQFGKTAIYLTDPFEMPEEFAFVEDRGRQGRVYLVICLSQSEYEYLIANDCEHLEDRLEECGVDPYDIRRKSCV